MRIAIQGEKASFHDAAARQWFGDDITQVACESFGEVFGVLNRHEADAAVVAIENSLYGGINQVYDLIESHGYPIVGEVHLPVHQQLIGRRGATITHVYSHPVALAQCADFLDTQCSEIDATAEDIQKEISLLEDYKKSVITEAVTKGLNPDAEMKDSGIEWIGEIPQNWNLFRLQYSLEEIKEYSLKHRNALWDEYVRILNPEDYPVDLSQKAWDHKMNTIQLLKQTVQKKAPKL